MSADMDYIFLKFGKGNAEASSLSGRRPTARIYFDDHNEPEYRQGKLAKAQPQHFWSRGQTKASRQKTVMVVIHQGTVWLVQPAGEVAFGKRREIENEVWVTPKTMPVRVLAKAPNKEVPPVLARIASSQAHGRRTFTRVEHWGNRKAINWTLVNFERKKSRKWVPTGTEPDSERAEHWRRLNKKGKPNQGPAQLLECLGSTEMETLVARLLESAGCHVPAHRGGTLGEIDLFAWNDTKKPIDLGGLEIPAGERVSIQVKTWADGRRRSKAVDYLIGIGVKGSRALDQRWLLDQVRKSVGVRKWLVRSLHWLPRWLLALPEIRLVEDPAADFPIYPVLK